MTVVQPKVFSFKMYMDQLKSQIARLLESSSVHEKLALLKLLLSDYDTPEYRKQSKAEARRAKYRLDATYREHVLEMKRDRCFERYWNDDIYREKLKISARERAAAESQSSALHAHLSAQMTT